jgi:hypothetical protein
MSDAVWFALVVVAFAGALTCHVTLVVGLWRRVGAKRGLLGLLVPPAAPYFGLRAHMWLRSIAWIACVVTYGVARLAQ